MNYFHNNDVIVFKLGSIVLLNSASLSEGLPMKSTHETLFSLLKETPNNEWKIMHDSFDLVVVKNLNIWLINIKHVEKNPLEI